MKIDSYSFGKIVIEGTTYTSDVIIYPDRVDASWWRKEGHRLHRDDIAVVLEEKPEVIIVGTGAYGVMKVPDETASFISSLGIELHSHPTARAVEAFTALSDERRVIACLHLTC